MPDISQHRFKMDVCDGQCAAQVLIYAESDDLEYWQAEAKRTNHKMEYSYSVPNDGRINTCGVAYDVYQILPLDYMVEDYEMECCDMECCDMECCDIEYCEPEDSEVENA